MSMPTYMRRFFLSLLIKNKTEENERIEAQKAAQKGGKGKRTTTISGAALKSKLNNGEIPLQ